MALVISTLTEQLTKAFADSMLEFLGDASSGATATELRTKASKKFGDEAAIAIDAYIKTANIIIPPGQAVTAGAPPGPGSTISPSLPAIIS